ncbi:hypothetical protein AcV5_008576 [Taiwanofungus camphoratus]|nr:hypothetical protein AcV5_008576 [Antrodia cinnamomea]
MSVVLDEAQAVPVLQDTTNAAHVTEGLVTMKELLDTLEKEPIVEGIIKDATPVDAKTEGVAAESESSNEVIMPAEVDAPVVEKNEDTVGNGAMVDHATAEVKGAIIDETQEPAKDALIDAVEPDATDAPGFEEISHGANGHAPIADEAVDKDLITAAQLSEAEELVPTPAARDADAEHSQVVESEVTARPAITEAEEVAVPAATEETSEEMSIEDPRTPNVSAVAEERALEPEPALAVVVEEVFMEPVIEAEAIAVEAISAGVEVEVGVEQAQMEPTVNVTEETPAPIEEVTLTDDSTAVVEENAPADEAPAVMKEIATADETPDTLEEAVPTESEQSAQPEPEAVEPLTSTATEEIPTPQAEEDSVEQEKSAVEETLPVENVPEAQEVASEEAVDAPPAVDEETPEATVPAAAEPEASVESVSEEIAVEASSVSVGAMEETNVPQDEPAITAVAESQEPVEAEAVDVVEEVAPLAEAVAEEAAVTEGSVASDVEEAVIPSESTAEVGVENADKEPEVPGETLSTEEITSEEVPEVVLVTEEVVSTGPPEEASLIEETAPGQVTEATLGDVAEPMGETQSLVAELAEGVALAEEASRDAMAAVVVEEAAISQPSAESEKVAAAQSEADEEAPVEESALEDTQVEEIVPGQMEEAIGQDAADIAQIAVDAAVVEKASVEDAVAPATVEEMPATEIAEEADVETGALDEVAESNVVAAVDVAVAASKVPEVSAEEVNTNEVAPEFEAQDSPAIGAVGGKLGTEEPADVLSKDEHIPAVAEVIEVTNAVQAEISAPDSAEVSDSDDVAEMDLSQSVAAEPVGVQDSVAVSREAPGVPSEQIPPTPEVAPEASSTLVETEATVEISQNSMSATEEGLPADASTEEPVQLESAVPVEVEEIDGIPVTESEAPEVCNVENNMQSEATPVVPNTLETEVSSAEIEVPASDAGALIEPDAPEEAVKQEVVGIGETEGVDAANEIPAISIDAGEPEVPSDELARKECETADTLLPEKEAEEDRPKSPWTPSYSVTMQGPGTGAPDVTEDGDEIAELEQLPPPAAEAQSEFIAPDFKETTLEVPVIVATPEEEQVTETAAADIPVAEPTIDASSLVASAGDVERPQSPSWVPSYSVNSQGASPLHSPKIEAIREASLEAVEPMSAIPASAEPALVEALEAAAPVVIVEVVEPDAQVQTHTEVASVETHTQVPIVQANEDAPEPPMISTTEEDVSELATEVLAPAASTVPETEDMPKSPSWVPSYSVSSQGASPLHTPHATDNVDVDQLQPLSAALNTGPSDAPTEELAPVEVKVTVAEAEAEVQPSALVTEDNQGNAEPPTISMPQIVESGPEPSAELLLDTSSVTPMAELERPKSPWTPSYSVIQQGASPLHTPTAQEEEELDQLERLPAAVTEAESVAVEAPVLPAESSNVQSEPAEGAVESVTTDGQSSILVDAAAEAMTETEVTSVTEERPARPWTPSYSVTTQGPGTPKVETAEDEYAQLAEQPNGMHAEPEQNGVSNGHAGLQAFPTTEDIAVDQRKVATKPSLARLAPVNEDEQIEIEANASQMDAVSLTTARTRLESTTSSRFFPGGWFSSTVKLPEETRMSHENAEGEFSKSPTSATPSPALEVPTNTPTDGVEDAKKRGKWCIIM